jgi:hypothetical protein
MVIELTRKKFRKNALGLEGKYIILTIKRGFDMIKPTIYEVIGLVKEVRKHELIIKDFVSRDVFTSVSVWEYAPKQGSRYFKDANGDNHWVHQGPMLYLGPTRRTRVVSNSGEKCEERTMENMSLRIISKTKAQKLKLLYEV